MAIHFPSSNNRFVMELLYNVSLPIEGPEVFSPTEFIPAPQEASPAQRKISETRIDLIRELVYDFRFVEHDLEALRNFFLLLKRDRVGWLNGTSGQTLIDRINEAAFALAVDLVKALTPQAIVAQPGEGAVSPAAKAVNDWWQGLTPEQLKSRELSDLCNRTEAMIFALEQDQQIHSNLVRVVQKQLEALKKTPDNPMAQYIIQKLDKNPSQLRLLFPDVTQFPETRGFYAYAQDQAALTRGSRKWKLVDEAQRRTNADGMYDCIEEALNTVESHIATLKSLVPSFQERKLPWPTEKKSWWLSW